ncbi:hypothetical protein QBC38DRAFT_550337 [Podospora fimiseda]|uniref:Nucleoside phosphorylase domain-containing protein n=1 Tax=Podospora fimiseda TaxID=252190 RepID=A0AAN6YMY4_9PEZI|nr:hypothetical protein QBC38DRAFT_550337 [Podospora fimiseda]
MWSGTVVNIPSCGKSLGSVEKSQTMGCAEPRCGPSVCVMVGWQMKSPASSVTAMDLKRPRQDEESLDFDVTWNHPKRPRTTIHKASHVGADTSHDVDDSPQFTHGDYTIAWICALPRELSASRAMLDEEHTQLPSLDRDDNVYILGCIHRHNVVMTCLPGQYGTNNAAIVATNLKRSFPNIRASLMVGIGGGSPSQADLYLGDVVVGTRIMQYDMGKVIAGGLFQETADPKIPTHLLNSAVAALRSRHEPGLLSRRMAGLLQRRLPHILRPGPDYPDHLFQASYEHPSEEPTCVNCDLTKLQPRQPRISNETKIHYGVIASGNRVIKDGKTRDNIARRLEALCFEMEAAGMMDNLQCLPIRGICDYSDSHKNKVWQDYSAANAAVYARELLEELPRKLDRPPTYITNPNPPDATGNGTYCPRPSDEILKRRQCLLNYLEFPQIDVRKANITIAHTKTCRWILNHEKFLDWLNHGKQSQNHGFLWIRGKAGAGKSTMMKFVYVETKKNSKKSRVTVASFFFNARGDNLERSVSGMYRSLLLQLLKEFSDLQSVLDDTDIVPRNQQDCPGLNILKELLKIAVMSIGNRRFTCFVDALDECDEMEARDMVQFFEDLAENAANQGIQFQICFSSRPYPYIDTRHGIVLTLEEESGHGEDLAQYVKSRLRITSSSLLEELQDRILKKAAGIFMWIVLVVDILNNESSHGALALRKKLSELPAKLGELFKSMLTRDQQRPESLKLCILWILCGNGPLSPAEFQCAMWAGLSEHGVVDAELPDNGIAMDAVKLVASSSKALAEVTKSKQPTVQFIHESVRDFLVKEKGIQDLWPELGFEWEAPSHEMLKRCCNTYLNHPRVQPIFKTEDGEKDASTMAERYPFLEYAGQQILYHANAAAPVVLQDSFLTQFFSSGGIKVINYLEKFKARRYRSTATPLYVLADKGLGNLIRIQMKKEQPVCVSGERYKYPLFAALANDHKSAIAALLGVSSTVYNGVDITEGLNYRKDLKDYKNRTPLSWAAQDGRLAIAQLLVDRGADVNAQEKDGWTALMRASSNGHEAVAQLLVDRGADVNAQDNNGWTALMRASSNGHEAVAALICRVNNFDRPIRSIFNQWFADVKAGWKWTTIAVKLFTRLEQQMEHLILGPVSELEKGSFLLPIRFIIVFGTLDECDSSDVEALLPLLEVLKDLARVQLRFLITSRPEFHIKNAMLRDVCRLEVLTKVDPATTGEDGIDGIMKLLLHEKARLAIKHKLPPDWLQDHQLELLHVKTGGLFIYAATACRLLDVNIDQKSRAARINMVLGDGGNFAGLDGMYRKVLEFPGREAKPRAYALCEVGVGKFLWSMAVCVLSETLHSSRCGLQMIVLRKLIF